jgi:uncharacterized protein YraI
MARSSTPKTQKQLQQAQQLIKQKQYDKARRLLEKIDDPRAQDWLVRLESRAPRKTRAGRGGGRVGSIFSYLLTMVISAALTSALMLALVFITAPTRGDARTSETISAATTATVQPSVTPPARSGVVVSNQNINVRSGPGTGNAAVAALQPGTRVEVLGESEDGQWYNVRLSNGTEGWVAVNLLDAEPAPTAVAAVSTGDATPAESPAPVETCAPEEAQAWYDLNRSQANIISYTLIMALYGQNNDYNALSALVQEQRAAFAETDYPGCVAELRETLLAAFQALSNAYINRARGFPNEAQSEMNLAMQQYERADGLFQTLGIVPAANNCGIEAWYAYITADVTQFLTTIDGIVITTPPSPEIRRAIFDLQELRRRLDLPVPDCAVPANTRLINAIDATIQLFQAIMAEDTAANKQTRLTRMVQETTEFLNEMRRQGIRIN